MGRSSREAAGGGGGAGRNEAYPPAARLRKRREILTVYQRGTRLAGSLLVLFILETDRGSARLGITATRKVGGAASRNRARRCVREAFRRRRRSLPSWDIVVNVKAKAVRASQKSIEADLLAQLARGSRRMGHGSDARATRRRAQH